MELNDLEKIRLEKVERLRQQGIDPYQKACPNEIWVFL